MRQGIREKLCGAFCTNKLKFSFCAMPNQRWKTWVGAIVALIILFSPMLGAGISLILSAAALMVLALFIHRLDPTYFRLHRKRIVGAFIVALVVAAAAVVVMRGFSGEDDWICADGQWVKHGNPSAPMPTELCGAGTGNAQALPFSYANPNRGFSIRYAEDMVFVADKEKIQLLGYIPLCDPETSLACIVYPESLLPGRNFQGGGVAVGILSGRTSEAACLASENEMGAEAPVTIGGHSFAAFRYGDAAMSHQSSGENYRAFVNNRCYQISTRINTTTFEVYEAGTIQRFTDAERAMVAQKLQEVVASFKFE